MKNFTDDRVSFRIDTDLKRWIDKQGASDFLRKLVEEAYLEIEGKKFEPRDITKI